MSANSSEILSSRCWYSSGLIFRMKSYALVFATTPSNFFAIAVGAHVVGEFLSHRSTANHDLDLIAQIGVNEGLDGLSHVRHRRREQSRHSEQQRVVFFNGLDKAVWRRVHTEVDDLEA